MTRQKGGLPFCPLPLYFFVLLQAWYEWRWESRGWCLWSCGQEGGRASLLFTSSAMHSIAFDVQSTGSLLISMMDNSSLLINIIFITNIIWPLPRIPFGRWAGHDWVFCCWRANEESHETICGGFVTFLGVRVRCWHICTSWQQNFYVGVKYHFILAFTLWMELWDYEISWVTQGFCWLQVYPLSLPLQFGRVFCNLRLHEILYCSTVLRPYDALLFTRVAELGSLSSGAKMAMKIFVKHVFTIFASNASILRVIANLQN